MSDELFKTIRLRRDEIGRPGGSDSAEDSLELELVSTQMLEQILLAEEGKPNDQIRELAQNDEGWLAREPDTNNFEIIKDEELELALRNINESKKAGIVPQSRFEQVESSTDETADDLCLVSTQHLRKVLQIEGDDLLQDEPESSSGSVGGFNPYDNG